MDSSRRSRQLAQACGVLVWTAGVTALIGWLAGDDRLKAIYSGPIVIKTNTAICLMTSGLALTLLAAAPRGTGWYRAGQWFAIVPLMGYVFDVTELYGIATLTGVALHTAICLLVLGAGVMLARPDAGAMRLFLAEDAAGMLMRRLIPSAIVLPIVLGRLRVAGERAGWYDVDFGRSLLILAFVVMFSVLTWMTASAVHAQTLARERAELGERALQDQLAATLESERAARALAERSSRLKDEFLATLSHELRTPLSAISGWAQILMSGQIRDADARRAYETIHRNALLQAQLVDDLLDMSRIEAGTLRLELANVDLAVVVDAALAAARPAMAAKSQTLEHKGSQVPVNV